MSIKPRGMDFFYRCSVFVCKIITRVFWARHKVTGIKWKDLPSEPLIVVANHVNWIDPVIIALTCPWQMVLLAKIELFETPVLKHLMRKWGEIPLNRGGADRKALRQAIEVLKEGRTLGLFPEGKRIYSGELQKGLSGAAFLALQTGAKIVPIGVTGTKGIKASPHPFHLGNITVNIGEPFELSRLNTENQKIELQQHTDLIMSRIAELLPEESRGMYANNKNSTDVALTNRG